MKLKEIMNRLDENNFEYLKKGKNIYVENFYPNKQLHIKEVESNIYFEDLQGRFEPLFDIVDLFLYHYLHRKELTSDDEEFDFWEFLYETYDFQNLTSDNSPETIESIVKDLFTHSHHAYGSKSMYNWKVLAEHCPECVIITKAYRAVVVKEGKLDPSLLSEPGFSWSKSLDGIKSFLNTTAQGRDYYLVEAVIEGLDLSLVVDKYKEHFDSSAHILDEEEIIAFKVIEITSQSFNSPED